MPTGVRRLAASVVLSVRPRDKTKAANNTITKLAKGVLAHRLILGQKVKSRVRIRVRIRRSV